MDPEKLQIFGLKNLYYGKNEVKSTLKTLRLTEIDC